MTVPAYWYRRTDSRPWLHIQRHGRQASYNFGDEYCSDFIRWWTGVDARRVQRRPRVIVGGSILHLLKSLDVVLSVGARSANSRLTSGVKYYGARGPLTAALIQRHAVFSSDDPFIGDIGMFVKDVYRLPDTTRCTGSLAVLPHFRDEKTWRHCSGTNLSTATWLSASMKPSDVASSIYAHEAVVTSSLHGLIFAMALGRRAYWVTPPKHEPVFKYKDFFLAVSAKCPQPISSLGEFCLSKSVPIRHATEIPALKLGLPSWDSLAANFG